MRSRFRDFWEGRHAHLVYDDGNGWMVVLRGLVMDDDALESPVRRIRRLAKKAALQNPDRSGLKPDDVSFIWPQRGSDKGG